MDLYPPLSISTCVTVKLTEENFFSWRSQFDSFLGSQNLRGFIDGTTAPPPINIEVVAESGEITYTRNPEYNAWYRSDQIVKTWILGSCEDILIGILSGCETSLEVWKSLNSHFNRMCSSRLQMRLKHLSSESISISDYIKEFKLIQDQLAEIGYASTDKMKVIGVLQGLGHEYDVFALVTESVMDILETTFEEVVSRLLAFEKRMNCHCDSSTQDCRFRCRKHDQNLVANACQICGAGDHIDQCGNRFNRTVHVEKGPSTYSCFQYTAFLLFLIFYTGVVIKCCTDWVPSFK